MTNRVIAVLSKPWALELLALLVLAANRFLISPRVGALAGESVGNYVFILSRVLIFFLVAVLLTRLSGFRRFQTLSAVGLLVAVEHLGFNLATILMTARSDPSQYPEGLGGPLFGLFMSYMVGLPMVLLIAFFGTALGGRK